MKEKKYWRLCPGHDRDNKNCFIIIGYVLEDTMWLAEECCRLCTSCFQKGRNCGENHPNYGISLYDRWVAKYGKEEADKKRMEANKKHSLSVSGSKNHMYGKIVYDIWLGKFGKEEADRRQEVSNKKNSESNSGEGNAMYSRSFYDVWVEKYGEEEASKRYKIWLGNILNFFKTKEGELFRERISRLMGEKRGEKHPMFGVSLFDIWLTKYGLVGAEEKLKDRNKKHSESIIGKNNPRYGISTYDIWVERYGKEESVRRMNEFRKKTSENNTGENNPMFGKSVYEVWIEKYGIEEADRRLDLLKEKHSENSIFRRNYLHHRCISGVNLESNLPFRSTCEYNFERSNPNLVSAESKVFRCRYISPITGKKRYYYPDYFDYMLNVLYEVKPIGWRNMYKPEIVEIMDAKIEAAKKMCEEMGWTYCIREVKSIPKKKMFRMREQGILMLDEKWENQYQEWVLNLCNKLVVRI